MLSFQCKRVKKLKTKQTPCNSRILPSKAPVPWKDAHIFKAVQVQVHEFVWGKGVIIQTKVFTTSGSCALLHSSPLLSFQNTGQLAPQNSPEQKEASFTFCYTQEEWGQSEDHDTVNLTQQENPHGPWHGLTTQPRMSFPVSAQETAGSARLPMKMWELR